MNKTYLMKSSLYVLIIFILSTTSIYANVGVPTLYLLFPQAIFVLIPIIIIEGYIIKRKTGLTNEKSYETSALMNAISTIVGIPITWFVILMIQFLIDYLNIDSVTNNPTVVDRGIELLFGSAWLPPSVENWELPAAVLVLLIPFFYMSWYVELFIAKKMLVDIESTLLKKIIFQGNIITYSLIGLYVSYLLIKTLL